ncbi:hypothetical protein D6779_04140 [Candidatus Parcubacteria bacterium]|nr:MAG: hypothetical protein D6779_04140 [Candidatus Parcubacteria bacterium]
MQLISRLAHILRGREEIGGLAVSPSFLHFVLLRGKQQLRVAQPLEPGTIVGGKIIKKEQLFAAFRTLREKIASEGISRRKEVNVIVSLEGFSGLYNSVFSIPIVKNEDFNEAAFLNLQAAAPGDFSLYRADWQVVSIAEKVNRADLLGIFAEKELVNTVVEGLRKASFFPVVMEPKAVSLARLLTTGRYGFGEKSYIVLSLDDNGFEFLVLRKGRLHFEYTSYWRDVYSEGKMGEIPIKDFENIIVRSVNQVFSFYRKKWSEQVAGILVSAGELNEEVKGIITRNFPSLRVQGAAFSEIGDEEAWRWVAAFGAAIRGKIPRRSDEEANLLGDSAEEEFHRRHIRHFFQFWRILAPAALLLLLGALVGTRAFLVYMTQQTENKLQFSLQEQEGATLTRLEHKVEKFNSLVRKMENAEGKIRHWHPVLQAIANIAQQGEVQVLELDASHGDRIVLSARAPSEDAAKEFRAKLKENPLFTDVELPLEGVQRDSSKKIFFPLRFSINWRNVE